MLKLIKRIIIVEEGGSSPTVLATRSSSALPGRRQPEMADMNDAPDSPQLEDLADRIRPRAASNLLLWAILGFVAVFLIWASFTELDRTVRGQGRIIASSQLQVVSNLEGGIVDASSCAPGSRSARARNSSGSTARCRGRARQWQATLGALRAKIARLEAEVSGRSPDYPADRARDGHADRDRAVAPRARMANLSAINAARRRGSSRPSARATEASATYQARVSAATPPEHELGAIRPLVERGIEPQLSLVRAESAAAVAGERSDGGSAAVARAQAGVVEARSVLDPAAAGLALAGSQRAGCGSRASLPARQRSLPALADRVKRTDCALAAGRPGQSRAGDDRRRQRRPGGATGRDRTRSRDFAGRGDDPAEGHRHRAHRPARPRSTSRLTIPPCTAR
jgi:adhesin transport system membrane fusion protein